ncbi:hypothetical protein SLEP1_g27144 [Rubroshorea leprosula]|uniref:Uncharacterized protein n=1 Tax=Rubroshorea leprosula TaxID=152421 RepID=A0AAV5K075_9ROSI|nr:hypothetical protein SLEP1_g27144 [Rubroshorea leprosula]
MSMSVSGTVVIQSPRGSESLSLQSSMVGIRYNLAAIVLLLKMPKLVELL